MACKRLGRADEESSSSLSSIPSSKRRAVTTLTVEKWILDHDKALNTSTWLKYDKADRYHVARLKCTVCKRFVDKIRGCRNFSPAYVEGSSNLRTSSFKDHAKSDMHERAMLLLKKVQSSDVCDYAPIAKAFYKMDAMTENRIKKKFDVAYLMAKEGIAFNKMKALCKLQERHGVDLGETYKNDQACAIFVDFIAQDLQERLGDALHKAKFFSIQMDGSTDSGNIEEELFLVIYFNPYGTDGSVHIHNRYFCVRQPKSVDAAGLFECLERALDYLGVDIKSKKLIGFGCDGASVNIAKQGVRGLIQVDRPWLITVWCLAHRLELSLKDALKNTLFSVIDEFLMRIYYVYSKAPKKCRELEEVVTELKYFLDSSEFPVGGNRPIRACGTRFVCHKVHALERILDRFGAYLNHLITLSEDSATKAVDRQKLKGYITKWRDSQILLGCAVFHDILKPTAILCKCLQADELCVVSTIEAILRTTASMGKLKTTELEELPSAKKVLERITKEDQSNGTKAYTYQGVEIVRFDQALASLKNNYGIYIDSILTCLRDRLKLQEVSDIGVLTDALKILATHGWEKTTDASFGYEAIHTLQQRFAIPLQEAGVNCALLQQEWDDVVFYAKQYINLVKDPYSVVWWKLFNSPDASKWENILTLVELTFAIPLSNGHVERCFSQLKLTKTDRRTSLGEDRLDHLLRIRIEGPQFEQWDATSAVGRWWTEKTRRASGGHSSSRRKQAEQEEEEFAWSLSDWEDWLDDSASFGGDPDTLMND